MESNSASLNTLHSKTRKWIASRFSPVTAVFSSQTVKDILRAKGALTPAELLRPFAEMKNLNNISLQTCEKNQPFRVKNFRIDFVDAPKIDGHNAPDQSILIDYIIQNFSPKKFQDGLNPIAPQGGGSQQREFDQIKTQLAGLVDPAKGSQQTPWFTKWKRQFLETTRFSDHAVTEQPVSFIYFISATEHDPLGTIDALRRAENLPSLYKEGVYDDSQQNILHFILILNPTDKNKVFQDAVDSVKQKYPVNQIFEVPMTKQDANFQGIDDIWANYVDLDETRLFSDNLDQTVRGGCFSLEDRQKIRQQMKRMIEKLLLPFIEKKIRTLEGNVANARKGFKNQFKNFWKKSERGENEGLKETFKMNKQELELVNLADLAFVAQDYETSMNNGKFPYSDFKSCKAFRHAASCQEVLLFSQLGFDPSILLHNNQKDLDAMAENAYALYLKSGKSQYLIRCAIYLSEMYDVLGRYQESANYLIKIANEIKDSSIIVPLLYEQAAYKYLHMKNYRKFALYMVMAGKKYEAMQLQNYSFNCFTIVHPFYQRHKGWNGIRFSLYSSLGRNSQNMGDINLAVTFFRNLLQLCCEFDHYQEQKNCLDEFLIAVKNWNEQKTSNLIGIEGSEVEGKAHIGQLNLPVVIEDSIEVFISSEKLFTNKPASMINSVYMSYPTSSLTLADENQEYVIQQKAELNSTNCPWKYLAKHVFEHMNEEKRKSPEFEIQNEACQFNGEEINEFAIYDCSTKARKRELTLKKVRKVFANDPITVKLLMRNPLMADISINKIRLICRYDDQKDGFTQIEKELTLRSLETKEIILEVIPNKPGSFIIERIEWILFDVVSCAYQLVRPEDKDKKLLTQEELVVSKKLLEREVNFKYEIVTQSAELSGKVELEGDEEAQSFIFTEQQVCNLVVHNQSSEYAIKNGFIVCSHPLMFGFARMRLFDKIEPNQKVQLPLSMRSSLMSNNDIKFLIRYEVDGDTGDNTAKYRFTRILFNIDSTFAFLLKRHVHLSTKQANEHIINIQIVDNFPPSSFYQPPQIQAIEIVNRKRQWTLKKKDEKGQFFIVMPFNQLSDEEPQSILKYSDPDLKSVFEDKGNKNFFEQELQFVLNKFKMGPTIEEEEVDIIVQWHMPKLNKSGFYSIFKVGLLKMHKQITEQQKKLQRQKTIPQADPLTGQIKTARDNLPKINPLHVAYQYQRLISYDFKTNNQAPLLVNFALSVSNLLQSNDLLLDLEVEAINEWSLLSNPADVSEGDSFLWVGKTKHCITDLKTNSIVTINLKCAISKPGVYNLNRLRINIKDRDDGAAQNFLKEIKLQDDILLHVSDSKGAMPSANLIDFAAESLI